MFRFYNRFRLGIESARLVSQLIILGPQNFPETLRFVIGTFREGLFGCPAVCQEVLFYVNIVFVFWNSL